MLHFIDILSQIRRKDNVSGKKSQKNIFYFALSYVSAPLFGLSFLPLPGKEFNRLDSLPGIRRRNLTGWILSPASGEGI
jgi:hypothetical protein